MGKGWKLFKGDFQGWEESTIEVGYAKIYNKRWQEDNYVAELDFESNGHIWQEFCLNEYYHLVECSPEIIEDPCEPETLKLKFVYAARIRVRLGSNRFKVYWN